MGIVRRLAFLLVLLAAHVQAGQAETWKRDLAGAEVDWRSGTITAQAGAAADIRMPGPNSARPGAERRARAAAEDKLRGALHALGQDKAIAQALERARVSRVEYQSNGGVVLWLTVLFSDLCQAKESKLALRLPSMPLSFAPSVSGAGKSVQVGFATYRSSSEAPSDAVRVRRDSKGHLALPGADGKQVDSFANAAVVIYLEKAQP